VRSTILKRDAKGVVRHGAEWLALWADPDTMKSAKEREEERQAQKDRATLARQLSAAARSLSGDPFLELDHRAADQNLRFALEELTPANLAALRGRIDSGALFRRFHDPSIHAALAPGRPEERRLFDLCELVRCEAQGAHMFHGVAENLVAWHLDRLDKADLLNAHLASLVPLGEAMRMVLRDTLLSRAEPSIATSGFWMWDRWLRARLNTELSQLAKTQGNQRAYGTAAKRLIVAIFAALEGRAEGPDRRQPTARKPSSDVASEGDSASEPQDDGEGDDFEPSEELFAGGEEVLHELIKANEEIKQSYKVFTDTHDRVVRADSLADAARLRQMRTKLDAKRAEFRRDFSRLVAQLQRRLMALQTRSWTFDLEEGLIDASRLDRVIVNPGFTDAYKQEGESLFRDTVVTLLIDNSGSMRGAPIEIACVVSDMIAAALEHCSVATEILGFTTAGWKGGKAAQDWARAGRPPDPGRLNDLLHIIYKSADEPLRRARNNICAMLSNDILKENIDGEALLWAARRLSARSEARKVMIVISDGSPVDQSTLEANTDKRILDRHLREVVANIERGGQVELAAIGIKHDPGEYYRNAIRVEKVEELGPSLIAMLDRMVAR